MTDIIIKNPLIGYTGEKLNLIQINFENADGSTRSENQEGTEKPWNHHNEPYPDEKLEIKGKPINPKLRKKDTKNKNTKNLGKKTKRKNCKGTVNINKIKNGKTKILFKLFNEFKSSSPLYKEYPQFNYIEKNLKNNLYSSLNELVNDIRNSFSQIFFSSLDSDKYNKIYILCESFEKIYKEYDNKLFLKESKNLHDIINKLKKELRQTEIYKNSSNINIIANHNIYYNNSNYIYNTKNRFKLHFNDSDGSENASEMSAKKYKMVITNKINKLSNDQKRGIRSIISENCLLEKNSESNVMKVDVNKMPFNQLKKLEKYVNKCIKDNNKNNNNFNSNLSLIRNESCGSNLNMNKIGYSKLALFEEEKEIDILKNDDLSSALSDDEDDEEDE
jgi:hypothetical protein